VFISGFTTSLFDRQRCPVNSPESQQEAANVTPSELAKGPKQVVQALAGGPGWGQTLFLVVYDENPVRIEIVHVYHGRQDWQPQD